MQTKNQEGNQKIKPSRNNTKTKYSKKSKQIQRRVAMDFLQTRFFNQTKFNIASIKNRLGVNQKSGQAGFITVCLLPFLSLMIALLISFAGLTVGIKNITQSQSLCIQQVLQSQKELGSLLTQLLGLNKKVSALDKARKTAEAGIKTAIASVVLAPKAPQLIKIRDNIKFLQKALIAKQKYLLAQSFLVKKQALKQLRQKLKKLKARQVQELTFYKKALAVQKEKIGSDAYIYKPMEDFKNHQKINFHWRLALFHPLEKSQPLFNNKEGSYNCTGSLEQRGAKWISMLYH